MRSWESLPRPTHPAGERIPRIAWTRTSSWPRGAKARLIAHSQPGGPPANERIGVSVTKVPEDRLTRLSTLRPEPHDADLRQEQEPRHRLSQFPEQRCQSVFRTDLLQAPGLVPPCRVFRNDAASSFRQLPAFISSKEPVWKVIERFHGVVCKQMCGAWSAAVRRIARAKKRSRCPGQRPPEGRFTASSSFGIGLNRRPVSLISLFLA